MVRSCVGEEAQAHTATYAYTLCPYIYVRARPAPQIVSLTHGWDTQAERLAPVLPSYIHFYELSHRDSILAALKLARENKLATQTHRRVGLEHLANPARAMQGVPLASPRPSLKYNESQPNGQRKRTVSFVCDE